MQQHHMPQAPPPPVLRPGIPGMPGLVNEFNRMHFDPNAHHFVHNMQQPAVQLIQPPPGYGHMLDPRSTPSNGKPPVGYVGYTFTKHPIEHVGQKETWAIVDKEIMPASQADLKDQVEKNRKKSGTGLSQYNNPDMKGFKRKQVDELIRECRAMDLDHRFDFTIASIKLDIKRRQSGPETSAMQVILKRQPSAGVTVHGPFMGIGNIRLPTSGLVDLSGAEEYEKSSQNSSNGHKPGGFPFERHLSEPWVHVPHPDARPPAHHAHSYEHLHPHNLGNAHGHGHGDSGGKEHAHDLEQPHHDHHDHHDLHEEAHDTKHGPEEKAKKQKDKKDKKDKSPKIVYVKQVKSHKSQDYSDISSYSDSDSSSDDTDQTPDTIISSEGSHYHHKDKKYHKSKHHRKSSSHNHEQEPVKVIYREHRRKEPTRRLSSPAPTHRSHYRYENVLVEPDYGHQRRAEPSYPRERFDHHHHHRAISYDDERFHDHDLRAPFRRPSVYRRRITSTAHPLDVYEERRRHEMLDREFREKEEAHRRRERYQNHREAARGTVDPDRMFHAHAPHARMDRMHSYHDDHLRGHHEDHFRGYHDDHY